MSQQYSLPEPLTLRMIGAVFWMGLLVYFVPQWFTHPVEFSPETARAKSIPRPDVPTITATDTVAALASQTNNDSQLTQPSVKQDLYIEKPLTIKAPVADPDRIQSLQQPLVVREAQTDRQGRMKANAETSTSLSVAAPPTFAAGKVWVQVATYQMESVAFDMQARLNGAGFSSKLIVTKNKKGQQVYQLRVGPYQYRSDGNKVKTMIDSRFKAKSVVLGK